MLYCLGDRHVNVPIYVSFLDNKNEINFIDRSSRKITDINSIVLQCLITHSTPHFEIDGKEENRSPVGLQSNKQSIQITTKKKKRNDDTRRDKIDTP